MLNPNYSQSVFGKDADKNPYAQVVGRSRPNTHSSSLQRPVPTPQQLIADFKAADALEKANKPTPEQRVEAARKRKNAKRIEERAQRRAQSA